MTIASTLNFSPTTPAPPSGNVNNVPQNDGGAPTCNQSFYTPLMTGDSGSGGAAGSVPAPPSGSAAAGKFLKADGTWELPPGTGSGILAINAQGTDYTAVSGDAGAIIQENSASAVTVTLPTSFATGFSLWVKNIGAGVCTVQAASGNIDDEASMALSQWQAMQFYWDGALWRALSQSLAV